MKTGTIVSIVIGFLLLLLVGGGVSSYNNMVKKRQAVQNQWANVESQYQQRMDLIPNLVATVKNAANFEKSTLEAVVNARASATKITIDPSKLDAASLQKFDQAQSAISQSLGRLLAVAENYPNLKATQNYSDLQTQLEGMEHRIATERMRFNKTVQDYDAYIQSFPQNIYAGMFGFQQMDYFHSAPAASKPVNVDSLFNK